MQSTKMMDQTSNPMASLVIRTVPGRLHFLDQAIFSLFCNDYPVIEVLIIIQSKQEEDYQAVVELTQSYVKSGLKINVLHNQTDRDERAKNLNLGIEAAMGRFIGFLDDDDVLYPHHVSALVDVLKQNPNTAWTYSDVLTTFCEVDGTGNLYIQSRQCFFKREGYSYLDLWTDNFIPLHSYLIDRSRVNSDLLQFDESFTVLEDYSFLLKLASSHPPIYHPNVTCEYRFRMDGSNSTCLETENKDTLDLEKEQRWELARSRISEVKNKISKSWTLQQKIEFRLAYFKVRLPTKRSKIILKFKQFFYKIERVNPSIAHLLKRLIRSRWFRNSTL
jgi:glycosyltransferase involved in cell wall biosynthesis